MVTAAVLSPLPELLLVHGWLLPMLGTPWYRGDIFGGQHEVIPTPVSDTPPEGRVGGGIVTQPGAA